MEIKLIKNGITLGEVSNYREDMACLPKKVHFDCRPIIHDVDGLFELLHSDGYVMTISSLEQIADGVASHIVAREVVPETNDFGAE